MFVKYGDIWIKNPVWGGSDWQLRVTDAETSLAVRSKAKTLKAARRLWTRVLSQLGLELSSTFNYQSQIIFGDTLDAAWIFVTDLTDVDTFELGPAHHEGITHLNPGRQ